MRVLHLGKYFPPHRGGMETHLEALATGLSRHIEVEVVVSADGSRSSDDVVNGVRVRRVASFGAVAATPVCPALLRIVRRARADLIHVHHPHPLAMLACLHSRTPTVVTYHSDIVTQRLLGPLTSPLVNAALRRSAAILVTSPQYLDSSRVLERHRRKCHVVPLGLDLSKRPSDHDAAHEIRRRFGDRVILAVGRLVRYKGFEFLLQAMRKVSGHLIVAGTGPRQRALETLIDRLQLRGRVTFIGDVPDLSPYYEACDLFVLPSIARNEAFGVVQLEAMAAGKPVVNTDIGSGVTYVSPDGQTGLTVAPGNAPALASAINRLLDDPSLRCDLGKAGMARVREFFSADAMVIATLDIYRNVLTKAGSS